MLKFLRSLLPIVLFTILLMLQFAFAVSTDQLTHQLENASGPDRLQILIELADRLLTLDEDQALKYLNEAENMATDLDNQTAPVDIAIQRAYLLMIHEDYLKAIENFDTAYQQAFRLDYTKGIGKTKLGKGQLWLKLDEYQQALDAFEEARGLFETIPYPKGIAEANANIGVVYTNIGGYDKALDAYLSAADTFEELHESLELADVYHNLGSLNETMGKHDRAVVYYTDALSLYEEENDKRSMATAYNSLGAYFLSRGLIEQSFPFFEKAYSLYEALGDMKGQADALLNEGAAKSNQQDYEGARTNYLSALEFYRQSEQKEGVIVATNNLGTLYYTLGDYPLAIQYHSEALQLSQDITSHEGLLSALKNLSLDYQGAKSYEESNTYMGLYLEMNDYLAMQALQESTENKQVLYETQKTERSLQEEKAAKAILIEERKRLILLLVIGGCVVVVISFLSLAIARERKKSEKLLLNILPKKIADKLKRFGKAEPERFNDVTVFFSDIVNFTTASGTLEPEILIGELNDLFTLFDQIMEAHGCERIKTIGDAYLAVCGMPNAFSDHGHRMVTAALEIRNALAARNSHTQIQWQMRIGIHTGSVVGGIVGIKKYIYDVFGDTINTASRMESNSEPMKVNISEATYALVQSHFDLHPRPEVEVKGKGMMKMFFVEAQTGGLSVPQNVQST